MKDGLSSLQNQILGALYFEEPFKNLVDEIKETTPVIRAELLILIYNGYAEAMFYNEDVEEFEHTLYFDPDRLDKFYFRITAKGLSAHSAGS